MWDFTKVSSLSQDYAQFFLFLKKEPDAIKLSAF